MDWLLFAVQWLHVLLGILWFGYALSMYFLVSPALVALPEAEQRDTSFRLGVIGAKVFPIVGMLVLLLGVLRGTVFGQIRSFEQLGTAYGITWSVALVATLALFYTGARYVGPAYVGLREAPDLLAAAARLRRFALFDLGLFFLIFTCMILMRFGL